MYHSSMLGAFVFLLTLIAIYLLPWIVAMARHRVSAGAILMANILFGWTVLGWVICMIWALTGYSHSTRRHA